jgi:hypothetical protein
MTLHPIRFRSIRLATLLVLATAAFSPLAEVVGLLPVALAPADDEELGPPCDCNDGAPRLVFDVAGETEPVGDDDMGVVVASFVFVPVLLPLLGDAREASHRLPLLRGRKPSSASVEQSDFERGPPLSA